MKHATELGMYWENKKKSKKASEEFSRSMKMKSCSDCAFFPILAAVCVVCVV